eukprot:TRINITY_DN3406_c0_g1_i2.p1 TRINITY_DN3406_c0_g1~~TRINITY_DN3406_c0_g1_i2.p1  ORF type:complete len:178 (-),score=15.65 TRINITY_DN3406_c0_g1_i2:123-656(-)
MCIRDRYQRRVHGENELCIQKWIKTSVSICEARDEERELRIALAENDQRKTSVRTEQDWDRTGTCLNLAKILSANSTLLMRNNIFALAVCKLTGLEELNELEEDDTQVFLQPKPECRDRRGPSTSWLATFIDFHVAVQDGNRRRMMTPSTTKCIRTCLLYTSPSPRDLSTSRMPSSA